MKRLIFLLTLIFPTLLFANPVTFDPLGSIGKTMVVGSMLALETIVVSLILLFFSMEIVPVFFALLAGNSLIYFILFLPIYSAMDNLIIAEIIIVGIDGLFIKIISMFDSFQMENFKKLNWYTPFICAAIGNALSYYVGTIMLH